MELRTGVCGATVAVVIEVEVIRTAECVPSVAYNAVSGVNPACVSPLSSTSRNGPRDGGKTASCRTVASMFCMAYTGACRLSALMGSSTLRFRIRCVSLVKSDDCWPIRVNWFAEWLANWRAHWLAGACSWVCRRSWGANSSSATGLATLLSAGSRTRSSLSPFDSEPFLVPEGSK